MAEIVDIAELISILKPKVVTAAEAYPEADPVTIDSHIYMIANDSSGCVALFRQTKKGPRDVTTVKNFLIDALEDWDFIEAAFKKSHEKKLERVAAILRKHREQETPKEIR